MPHRGEDRRARRRRGKRKPRRRYDSAVTPSPADIARRILSMCESAGFALAGVCDAAPSGRARELAEWLEAGRHGSMGYLEKNVEARLDPRTLLPGARSMVLVADLYAAGAPDPPPDPGAPARGRVARYARGRDYHDVLKRRLHTLADALRVAFPSESFRAFVDTAPVLEREHAARAGLGWIGKHTLLIHPRLGSYSVLGGLLTTMELAPPEGQRPVSDHCGTCTRCVDACPTGAITPYSVDATRCVSYLTIERREAIDPSLHEGMRDWIFGCDVCQEVCPHNRPREAPAPTNPAYAPRRDGLDLLTVLGWTEDDRREAFMTSSMKRATLAMMKRNAVIVAGNELQRKGDPALRARLREIALDESEAEMVREAARQALARLMPPSAGPPSPS